MSGLAGAIPIAMLRRLERPNPQDVPWLVQRLAHDTLVKVTIKETGDSFLLQVVPDA